MDNATNTVVEQFIQYLNEESFDHAEKCLNPDFKFIGVMGKREGASVYIQDMKKMKFKYEILKTFTSGEDVCLWYHIDMGRKTLPASGWYEVKEGKIHSLNVLFDPRPLLSDDV
ncbi:nuclear transport factor 2 family protein [Chryseobacterium pennipullorum]|uniref:Nuclear transport factor 2 family protein n=1 Tax=Chryseobacterium pennipullorum TaxID=2258963 RepID=A0A3D9B1E1_9FLAO|nr:nuclear transport factor 2 family protein [Chryseobacterium pennipullorum]REC47424.1 nuclear transport factor 2 family protein [Chryseobacterium pennipullorum]